MQSLSARTEYRNSAHCAYRIFTEEGVLKFWKGTTPRLARLIVSFSLGTKTGMADGLDERRYHLYGLRSHLPASRTVRLEDAFCSFDYATVTTLLLTREYASNSASA